MGRIDKINQAIRKEIGNIVQFELKDPRLEFITITQVEVTKDLQHAKVYFSFLGDASKMSEIQKGLNSARGFVRKLVGQRVKLRYTPEIDFIFDESIEYSIHIDQTIERIKNELKGNP